MNTDVRLVKERNTQNWILYESSVGHTKSLAYDVSTRTVKVCMIEDFKSEYIQGPLLKDRHLNISDVIDWPVLEDIVSRYSEGDVSMLNTTVNEWVKLDAKGGAMLRELSTNRNIRVDYCHIRASTKVEQLSAKTAYCRYKIHHAGAKYMLKV